LYTTVSRNVVSVFEISASEQQAICGFKQQTRVFLQLYLMKKTGTNYRIMSKKLVFDQILVNRGGKVMKPGKNQRSKQRCQDSCWKVHDRLQSFVLPSYTMYDLRNQNISIDKFLGQ